MQEQRIFLAYIMPFHDYFCGWVLSGGSLSYLFVFAHKPAPLQSNTPLQATGHDLASF
jgi:hypothetical protein